MKRGSSKDGSFALSLTTFSMLQRLVKVLKVKFVWKNLTLRKICENTGFQ